MDQWITVDGRHIDIGAGGAGTPLSKSEKAKLAYKGGDKHEQDLAEKTEAEMAEALGMPRTPDNRAFDLTGPIQFLGIVDLNALTAWGDRTELSFYHTFPNSQNFGQIST